MADKSACPRCAVPRTHREGPYFVCHDCRWRWTVSVTGLVYVQSEWTPPFDFDRFSAREQARLRAIRAAVHAGFYNDL